MSSLSLLTAPVAGGAVAAPTACFSVHAHPEPGILPRIFELFAKRGLVPQRCHSSVSGTVLSLDLQVDGLDRDVVDYIARCMRQIVGVEVVLTSQTAGN